MTKEYFYCPKCKSPCITSGKFHHEAHYRKVDCEDCGFIWIEQFEIVGNYTLEGEELGDPE
jgi:hypothetical protein